MNKLLITIATLFAYSGMFSQTWNTGTGAWISPLSKNIGIQKSLQVGDNLGTDSLWCKTDLNYFEGNVGIGTSNPSEKLEVIGDVICDTLHYNALDPAIGTSWGITGNTLAAEGTLGTLNNYGVAIKTNNVERMRIGGNTGLGGQRTIGIGNNSSADPNPNNSTVLLWDKQTYDRVSVGATHWVGMDLFQEVSKTTGTSADNDAIFAFASEAKIGAANTKDWGGLYGLEAIRGSVVTSAGATGTITSAYALFSTSHLESMNVTNRYGLWVENPYRPGGHTNVTTNNYGIYVQSQTVGTTNYNIYSEGGRHYMSHALAANGSTSTLTCASTSSGSTGGVYQIGLFASMAAGYTGTGAVYTTQFNNTAAGIGADPYTNDYGNFSTYAACAGTTTGTNVGAKYDARNGDVNIGLFGQTKIAKNNATNIGVLGQSINTGSSPIQIGGYFGLQSTTPTYASAALMADNGATTSDIFVARDNGTATFTIADAGAITATGTTMTFSTNASSIVATGTGSNGLTLKNLKNSANTAVSGTAITIQIDIGGTPYYFLAYPTSTP